MSDYFVDKSECAAKRIFPGVDIFTTHGSRLMLSLVEMAPHAVVEEHSHMHEQLGMMLEGEAEFTIGGEHRVLTAGQIWRIPGGVPHRVVAGARPVRALDVFYPIRDDYR